MLEIVDGGLLTTVQDLGRPAAVHLGVPHGGACDGWSLRVANALAGNEPDAAALEITLAGPTLRAVDDCLVGLAGADLGATVVESGERLEPGRALVLARGQTLAFGDARERAGVRAYLALAGGIDVPPVLGSGSTCLTGRFGGFAGRPLSAGDVITSRRRGAETARGERRWLGGPQPASEACRRPIRVLPGPHLDKLLGRAFERLVAAQYVVSGRGNRQGIVLDGPTLALKQDAGSMLSQPLVWGAIQVPPDGRPICLLADHQTVGGYPVVAVVISADLPALGQLGPADPVRFSAVEIEQAELALQEQEQAWQAGLTRLGDS